MKKNFCIFKGARTGSTALAYALNNESSDHFCFNEVLNHFDPDTMVVEDYINTAMKETSCAVKGFTLNPLKNQLNLKPDFWTFPDDGAQRYVFSLSREPLDCAVSRLISKKLNVYPGSRILKKKAAIIIEYANSTPELDVDDFMKVYKGSIKSDRAILKLSEDFSALSGARYIPLQYESLYQGEKTDIDVLESALSIVIDRELFHSDNKILPKDLSYIANAEQIMAAKAEVDSSLQV